jgi:hypothetical protein
MASRSFGYRQRRDEYRLYFCRTPGLWGVLGSVASLFNAMTQHRLCNVWFMREIDQAVRAHELEFLIPADKQTVDRFIQWMGWDYATGDDE